MKPITVHAFTDAGRSRTRNEDAVLAGGWLCQTHTGALTTMQFPMTLPFVCAVADGMGGHAAGDAASRLALSVIAEVGSAWRTPDDVRAALRYVNDQIRHVGADPELHGLGTTVAGVCVAPDRIIAFNVGDSRVYTIEDGFLEQISVDDSVHDEHGRTTNRVTQSMGQPGVVDPHIVELPTQAGAFLICSDGVSGVLSAADLRAAVLSSDHEVCANAIIATTQDRGADDNFSLLLVEIPRTDADGAACQDEATSTGAPAVSADSPSPQMAGGT